MTLIEILLAGIRIGFVSLGCYFGWKLRSDFFSMFLGGIVGGFIFFCLLAELVSWANRYGRE